MTKFMVTNEGRRLSSREFARQWPALHKNVMRRIRQIVDMAPEIARLNFEPVEYMDSNNQPRPEFLMTSDGFHLLCMEMGGIKALKTKWAWIQATKKILEETAAIMDELKVRRSEVEELRVQLEQVSLWAKRLASGAGRTLNEWKSNPSRQYLMLEANGQRRLIFEIAGDAPEALPEAVD